MKHSPIALMESMSPKVRTSFILTLCFLPIVISIQLYLLFFCLKDINFITILLNIIIILAYIYISLSKLITMVKLEKVNKSLEEANIYNHTLQVLHDDIRTFRHDSRNILQCIGGYLDTNDISGLKEYYKDIRKDCEHQNSLSSLNPKLIKNSALYSLIASKYQEADNSSINFEITILSSLDNIPTSSYVISRILGILLDNAIAAAKDSEEKKIYFLTERKSNKLIISIENSYSNKDVDIDRIREKGYTSKNFEKGSHGLGLWEVNNILNKSKNLNLYTSKNDNVFKQQLEIYDI